MIKTKEFKIYSFVNIIFYPNDDVVNFEVFIRNEQIIKYSISVNLSGDDE